MEKIMYICYWVNENVLKIKAISAVAKKWKVARIVKVKLKSKFFYRCFFLIIQAPARFHYQPVVYKLLWWESGIFLNGVIKAVGTHSELVRDLRNGRVKDKVVFDKYSKSPKRFKLIVSNPFGWIKIEFIEFREKAVQIDKYKFRIFFSIL